MNADSGTLIELGNHVDTPVQTDFAAVQAELIVVRLAPLGAGIELIVGLPLLVLVVEPLGGGFLPLAVHRHGTLGPLLIGGMDKYRQAVCHIPQNVVGTAAHDDTGLLLGQVGDDLLLGQPHLVRGGLSVPLSARHGIVKQPVGGCVLAVFLDVFLSQAALGGDLFDEVAVVARDPQLGGHFLADGPAAAAEFPADGDHPVVGILFISRPLGGGFWLPCVRLWKV